MKQLSSLVGSERDLCLQLARYMSIQHPGVLYHFDYGSGLKMTMNQAVMQKRLNRRAWPDLFIAASRHGMNGLFLELKKSGTTVFKKIDGMLTSDPHIREQHKTIHLLQHEGYAADFAIGFDDAVAKIRAYLNEEPAIIDESFVRKEQLF